MILFVLLILSSPKDFPKARYKETSSLLTSLVKIAMNVKSSLPWHQVKFLCCLAKCTASAIDLQKAGLEVEDNGEKEDDERNLGKSYAHSQDINGLLKFFNELIKTVKEFLYFPFYRNLEDCKDNTWKNDLHVSIKKVSAKFSPSLSNE